MFGVSPAGLIRPTLETEGLTSQSPTPYSPRRKHALRKTRDKQLVSALERIIGNGKHRKSRADFARAETRKFCQYEDRSTCKTQKPHCKT